MIQILKFIVRLIGFHVHEWGRWEDKGEISAEGRTLGKTQERTCIECGRSVSSKVWWV